MANSRRNLFVNQWYLGAGSKISFFTRKPERPFAEVKELYLMEIETATQDKPHYKKLTFEQKQKIKQRVKKQIRKQNLISIRNSVLALIISIVIVALLYYAALFIINWLRESF